MAETKKRNINIPEKVYYHGNIVYRDGRIFNALGEPINIRKNNIVPIFVNGKKRLLSHPVLIYRAFTGDESRHMIVTFGKDKSFDNLIIRSRKETLGKQYQKNAIFTKEDCKRICEEAKLPYTYPDGRRVSKTPFRVLAERYGCSYSTISKIVNGYYPRQSPDTGEKKISHKEKFTRRKKFTEEQCRKIKADLQKPYTYPNGRVIDHTPYRIIAERYECCQIIVFEIANDCYLTHPGPEKTKKRNEGETE